MQHYVNRNLTGFIWEWHLSDNTMIITVCWVLAGVKHILQCCWVWSCVPVQGLCVGLHHPRHLHNACWLEILCRSLPLVPVPCISSFARWLVLNGAGNPPCMCSRSTDRMLTKVSLVTTRPPQRHLLPPTHLSTYYKFQSMHFEKSFIISFIFVYHSTPSCLVEQSAQSVQFSQPMF